MIRRLAILLLLPITLGVGAVVFIVERSTHAIWWDLLFIACVVTFLSLLVSEMGLQLRRVSDASFHNEGQQNESPRKAIAGRPTRRRTGPDRSHAQADASRYDDDSP